MDNELDLLKKMQRSKQERIFFEEYPEQFYRVLIRIGHAKIDKEKVVCYLNGLRGSIQGEMSLVRVSSIEEAHQFFLRVEEKLSKNFDNKNSGRGHGGRSGG